MGDGSTMEQLQDEQLFGAPPGIIEGITFAVGLGTCELKSVIFYGHTAMRNKPMQVSVMTRHVEDLSTIVGKFTPLLLRSGGMSTNHLRRTLWAIHNALGRLGYEVSIDNCGREPKH